MADSTKERHKISLKDVLEEFETKVIAAASKLQEQLANNAERTDAPAAAAQTAIDARRRKRDAEVDDVLTPSQPPIAKARSSKTAKKRNLASSSAAPHVPESDSDDGARRQAPTAKARSSKTASKRNLASSSEAPLLLAADADDDGAVLKELKRKQKQRQLTLTPDAFAACEAGPSQMESLGVSELQVRVVLQDVIDHLLCVSSSGRCFECMQS